MSLIKKIKHIESENIIFERFLAENPEIRENYEYWLEKKKLEKKGRQFVTNRAIYTMKKFF